MKYLTFILINSSLFCIFNSTGLPLKTVSHLHIGLRLDFNIFNHNSDITSNAKHSEITEKKFLKIEKSMRISPEQYHLGIKARQKMESEIRSFRAIGGHLNKGVIVERDGLSPPIHLIITITRKGKSLGKTPLQNELILALKESSDGGKRARDNAHLKMLDFISAQIKTIGSK